MYQQQQQQPDNNESPPSEWEEHFNRQRSLHASQQQLINQQHASQHQYHQSHNLASLSRSDPSNVRSSTHNNVNPINHHRLIPTNFVPTNNVIAMSLLPQYPQYHPQQQYSHHNHPTVGNSIQSLCKKQQEFPLKFNQ